MIGTEEAARLALAGSLPFIGSGFTREVFVLDNVVYKIETPEGRDMAANRSEMSNAMRIRAMLPDGVTIPEMSIHNIDGHDILAMEYISGEETGECEYKWMDSDCPGDGCVPESILSAIALFGIFDCASWGNVIRSDDILYLIDIVC